MTPLFFRIKSFLSYWLNAVDEHSLHSPFFFDFHTTVVRASRDPARFSHIEALRQKLLRDKRVLDVEDFGAKSNRPPLRRIAQIARTSLSAPRFSALYYRIAHYFRATTIVELGTSFGINTLYLAQTPDATVATFEGSKAVAEVASITFEFASADNVKLIVGDIARTLPTFLQETRKVDLAFIDANHRYEPTVKYFDWLLRKVHERSVIIVDDIYYSGEMTAAWHAIRNHRLVYASADLFRCGIVFFDPSLNKQHVILQV